MRNSKLKLCLALVAGLTATAGATSMQEAIQQLTGDAAKQYVAPIVSGIGADLNAGWYHKAPPAKKFRFSIEGGALVMGAMLGDGKKSFSTAQSFQFDSAQSSALIGHHIDTSDNNPLKDQAKKARLALIDTIRSKNFSVGMNGPTIIGSSDSSANVKFTGVTIPYTYTYNSVTFRDSTRIPDTTVALKNVTGLLGDFTSYPLPLIAPQVTLGTVYGTNVTLRWLPTMPLGDVGNFSFFGFGIQHNPAVWFNTSLPVDFCVGYFHQDLTFGSLFDASTNAYGIDVSKQLGWRLLNITPYAGFQLESSTMSFHYDFKASQKDVTTGVVTKTDIPVKFDLEGDNSTRLTVGISVHVLILNINADYNLAKYNSLSAGIMFGI